MRFCRHRFRPIRVKHVWDVSFGEPGVQRTDVYERCVKCPKTRLRCLDGFWDLSELVPTEEGAS